MYGEVVDGIDGARFEHALSALKEHREARSDTDLTTADLRQLVTTFKQIYFETLGRQFPQDPHEQLRRAIQAVFRSWLNPRAQVYRRLNGIPDSLGTAANVVEMVFGNAGEQSATGVAFSRDPSTGEPRLTGEFLLDAQGEDVVAGIRAPQPLDDLRMILPEAYGEFADAVERLERHYRDVQDVEFTIERGKLFILQTRSAKRTAAAAVKSAVDMAHERLITRGEAVLRIDPTMLEHLLHPTVDPTAAVECRGDRAGCSRRAQLRVRSSSTRTLRWSAPHENPSFSFASTLRRTTSTVLPPRRRSLPHMAGWRHTPRSSREAWASHAWQAATRSVSTSR